MAKSYRPVDRDQGFLLPPDMRQWLPADHLVWFVLDMIEQLDISAFEAHRRVGGAGTVGFDPRMLAGLLVYAYCHGVRSSREIERLCHTDVAFRVLCAQDGPDHCTIARFRAQCGEAFEVLFTQVLQVAAGAGLAHFGTVAIDGTKIAANASLEANRSRGWLAEQVATMTAEAASVDAAEDRQAALDGEARTDRVPAELADTMCRQARIQAALADVRARNNAVDQTSSSLRDRRPERAAQRARRRAARAAQVAADHTPMGRPPDGADGLAEARTRAERVRADQQAKRDAYDTAVQSGRKPMGRPPKAADEHARVQHTQSRADAAQAAVDAAKAATDRASDHSQAETHGHDHSHNTGHSNDQDRRYRGWNLANISDPDSRVMSTRRGFAQAFNAQVAVTADQLIVAADLVQDPTDFGQFTPMMAAASAAADRLYQTTRNSHHRIGTILADAGYASHKNLVATGPDRLIALGKSRRHAAAAEQKPASGPPPAGASPRQVMDHRLRTEDGHSLYKRRGATVEPAIGNLKKIITQFSTRGLANAKSELHLAASAYNLMKIYRAATS